MYSMRGGIERMKKTWIMAMVLGFSAACWMGCSTVSDYGTPSDARGISDTDRQLKMDVQNRLQEDAVASRYLFGVDCRDGVITLYGPVPDEGTRLRVLSVVQGTPGVRDVNDRLTR